MPFQKKKESDSESDREYVAPEKKKKIRGYNEQRAQLKAIDYSSKSLRIVEHDANNVVENDIRAGGDSIPASDYNKVDYKKYFEFLLTDNFNREYLH